MSVGKRDGHNTATDTRQVKVRLYCSAAVTAKNCLTLDLTDTTYGLGNSFKHTSAITEAIFAVAAETTTAAGWVECYVKGIVTDVNVEAATTAGIFLMGGATAGRAQVYAETDVAAVGAMALEADTSNVADIMLFDLLGLAD